MIVIEVLGGVVQAVYSDDPSREVVLIDWDNINIGGTTGVIRVSHLDQVPEETRQQILRVERGTEAS
ncbi:MAG TPA: hypothetical protein VFA07_12770 [Chthonomonadaceae bacterium]|nr:hypothetical protein [Chthonomonadaceae bacterium]